MTAAIQVDIDVEQGATFRMQVTWADATTDPATPISLSGYRALMQIRAKAGAVGTPLVELTSEESSDLLIEPSDATGVVQVRIGADKTRLLKKSTYAYDLFIISRTDATEAVRLAHGAVNVSKSVTIDSA